MHGMITQFTPAENDMFEYILAPGNLRPDNEKRSLCTVLLENLHDLVRVR